MMIFVILMMFVMGKLLLEAGADPMLADIDGHKPVDAARKCGHRKRVKQLKVRPGKIPSLLVMMCYTGDDYWGVSNIAKTNHNNIRPIFVGAVMGVMIDRYQ